MTNDEQYVPSDEDMRWHYAVKRMDDGATRTHAEQEYTRWLAAHDARVRRDAEAELDSWMARAYEAEGKLWKAEARIKAVEDALDWHPDPRCDQYADGDPIACGWKHAYADIRHAMEG